MAKGAVFHFPSRAAAKLQSIKRLSRIDNNADVIRVALERYDDLLDVTLAGCKIIVRDKEGKDRSYSPFERFEYPGLGDDPSGQWTDKFPKNFVLSPEAVERLEGIRKKTGLGSNADVIRASLSAFDELLRVAKTGDAILVCDHAGDEHTYNPHTSLRHQHPQLFEVTKPSEPTRPSGVGAARQPGAGHGGSLAWVNLG